MIWVAYNEHGDCIADGDSYDELVRMIEAAGYYESEVLIGKVTP